MTIFNSFHDNQTPSGLTTHPLPNITFVRSTVKKTDDSGNVTIIPNPRVNVLITPADVSEYVDGVVEGCTGWAVMKKAADIAKKKESKTKITIPTQQDHILDPTNIHPYLYGTVMRLVENDGAAKKRGSKSIEAGFDKIVDETMAITYTKHSALKLIKIISDYFENVCKFEATAFNRSFSDTYITSLSDEDAKKIAISNKYLITPDVPITKVLLETCAVNGEIDVQALVIEEITKKFGDALAELPETFLDECIKAMNGKREVAWISALLPEPSDAQPVKDARRAVMEEVYSFARSVSRTFTVINTVLSAIDDKTVPLKAYNAYMDMYNDLQATLASNGKVDVVVKAIILGNKLDDKFIASEFKGLSGFNTLQSEDEVDYKIESRLPTAQPKTKKAAEQATDARATDAQAKPSTDYRRKRTDVEVSQEKLEELQARYIHGIMKHRGDGALNLRVAHDTTNLHKPLAYRDIGQWALNGRVTSTISNGAIVVALGMVVADVIQRRLIAYNDLGKNIRVAFSDE